MASRNNPYSRRGDEDRSDSYRPLHAFSDRQRDPRDRDRDRERDQDRDRERERDRDRDRQRNPSSLVSPRDRGSESSTPVMALTGPRAEQPNTVCTFPTTPLALLLALVAFTVCSLCRTDMDFQYGTNYKL